MFFLNEPMLTFTYSSFIAERCTFVWFLLKYYRFLDDVFLKQEGFMSLVGGSFSLL